MQYLEDPDEISRRSFATIRAETDLSHLPESVRPVAVRLVHACGMADLVDDLAWSPDVVARAKAALARGASILVDSRMAAAGVMAHRLPAASRVICLLDHPDLAEHARTVRTTRSAAAVDLRSDELGSSVVVIGNAPTALFRLLERLDEGAPKPAAILAFPVGFVGAAEAKEALIEDSRGVAFLTVRGRRGGSALAAAAVNALSGGEPPR